MVAAVPAPVKKKRNLPKTPDPGAEVIALSPRTLLSTNRFVCKVFEREFTQDQVIMKPARASRIENQDAIDTAIIGMLADPKEGQVFLSPRTIGFYSSMFGRKTKFYFLWEDIEDIQGIPQSISSWSPSIIITLHKGIGMDAKHGAKSMDNGKLKFCLQSFASFSVANRTIMALWKARSLSTELKVQLAEEQSQINTLQSEDSGVFVGIEDAKSLQMTEVFSSTISTNMASLMEVFAGGSLEMKLHIKYQVEDLAPKQRASNVQVSLGIEWSKSTRHQKRIEKNVLSSSSARLKEMFSLASRELSHAR
ncbi:C2 and GRAM domain-containing protein [Zea mays]|uniref:C2 and GRAM domain-containing protein n=1 Tax=Zea mays TaxID=4577 RepID=A0A3L6DNF5_MAIZE|nr:C2 and GRAM domain-containing protein [Zea mays]